MENELTQNGRWPHPKQETIKNYNKRYRNNNNKKDKENNNDKKDKANNK